MVLDLVSELKYFYTRFYQCIHDLLMNRSDFFSELIY